MSDLIGLRGRNASPVNRPLGSNCQTAPMTTEKIMVPETLLAETLPTDAFQADALLDACGLVPPAPILALRRHMKTLKKGAVLELRTSDAAMLQDVPYWCEQAGHTLLMVREADGVFVFFTRKGR